MTTGSHVEPTIRKLDTIAWKFLGSEFTGQTYADWPIDRRVDAYLWRHGLSDIVNDGGAYNTLLDRVMANLARARRDGLLPEAHR